MQLIRHLPCPLNDTRKSALTIGNFDGLHRGHLALVKRAVAKAPELAPALMCFEPLPLNFFRPDRPVPRLMKLRDRFELCRDRGIVRLFQLRFDQAFAAQSPEEFVERIVIGGARAGHVIVGEDFRFGRRAAGDVDDLRRFGRENGFSVEIVTAVLTGNDGGDKISSTALRQALAEGELDRARHLLGRPYRISGRVLRGEQLGRKLGFPTINLRVPEPPAPSGVFAVQVHGLDSSTRLGVANLGKRPTVAGRDWLLEVHLIDFDGDLYGRHVAVDFIAKRRDEAHFNHLDEMIDEMQHDLRWAREQLHPQAT
ncbi:MAG: bifunctional riboflavin kinase/FAD synthetase [Pseudomonadota bacterium]